MDPGGPLLLTRGGKGARRGEGVLGVSTDGRRERACVAGPGDRAPHRHYKRLCIHRDRVDLDDFVADLDLAVDVRARAFHHEVHLALLEYQANRRGGERLRPALDIGLAHTPKHLEIGILLRVQKVAGTQGWAPQRSLHRARAPA